MVHQRGWAMVDHDTFGEGGSWEEATSSLCMCMREAQCTWYQHPENYGCTDIHGQRCINEFWGNSEVPKTIPDATIPGTCSGGEGPAHDEAVEGFERTGGNYAELGG